MATEKFEGEEGDIILEPFGDESPDAMVQVIPADKTKQPFMIPRRDVAGLNAGPRFSVSQDDVPETHGGALPAERPSVLPALILAAFSGALVGVIAGLGIGALLWA
jgi:hypothetical protein